MGKMEREKGKRGEREFASMCRDAGFDVHRGRQYQGGDDSPDVKGLPGIHVEVKRTEALRLYDAMAQAKAEKGADEIPIVAHRKNDCGWLVIMTLDDFFKFYREWVIPFKED
jgi:Holliday junction resolvase